MYEYLDRPPQVGDIVQWVRNTDNKHFTKDKLYIVDSLYASEEKSHPRVIRDDGTKDWAHIGHFKVIKTKPRTEVQVGDTVFCTSTITLPSTKWLVGTIYTINDTDLKNSLPQAKASTSNWNSCDSFVVLCKAQQKEQPMQITDYIVDIANSTLADRLVLRQVLLDNGQKVDSDMHTTANNTYYMCTTWYCGSHISGHNISLADFINKFKKQDKLRNLAFYKRSGENWKLKEVNDILTYVGDATIGYDDLSTDSKFIYDTTTDVEFMNWDKELALGDFKNCLQVAYEDVFPVTKQTSNPFKVGDRVRCISNPNSTRKIGDEFTVVKVHNDDVYYKDGFAAYYKYFELVSRTSGDSTQVEPTNQTTKEQPMTIQQLLQTLFGAEKPTTDYDKRPTILVVAYNRDGSQMGQAIADNIEQVKAKVADTPELWGCKVLTYTLDQEVSVEVPVKATKAKVAKPIKE